MKGLLVIAGLCAAVLSAGGTPGTPSRLVAIVEDATIIGGTGRFAGATGSVTINRLSGPVNRTTTGSFEGTICCPQAETLT